MIRIENMSFIYPKGRRNIHTNLSLNLEENKIYGLLGKNGTGKSTLLYLIAGLLKPTKGTITMDAISDETGEAVNHSTFERHPEVLRETFFVNEEYTLPPLTLDEWSNSLGGFYPTYSEEMFRQCLADFDITGNPKLTTLSMGQQKKIIISFALASGVKYLFMDEPTNGLDIPSKSQFRKVVSSCMSEERTIIISTHQVHDIEFLLDHIIIIDNDRLLLNAYQEPTLQGNATMAYRKSTDPETNLNLELLFNATVNGLFK